MQSHLAPTEPGYAIALTNFVKRIKETSNGRIDIQLYPAGSLVPSKEIVQSVARRIVEMGASAASYNSGLMPVVYTTLVPMGPRSAEDCALIWFRGWGDILRKAYDRHGVKLLTMQIMTDIPLYSTKPLKTADDFKGLKIRTHGSTALFVEQLGASTVFIPGEEVYMALSTGTIEAATWGGFAATFPKKWYEVAKYIIHPALVPMFQQNDIVINKRAFNSLPPDLQAIVQTAADLLMWDARMVEALGNDEALAKMKAAGNEILTLPSEELLAVLHRGATGHLPPRLGPGCRGHQKAHRGPDQSSQQGDSDVLVREARAHNLSLDLPHSIFAKCVPRRM